MLETKGINLFDLQFKIKEKVTSAFSKQLWVRGEINAIKVNPNGHCYIDLVDKGDSEYGIRAKAQAIIWSSSWRVIRPYFKSSTGSELAVGMKVLLMVQVSYSELYGLSLVIYDIDPSFTVGEFELQRARTIEKLKKEGAFDLNATLELPSLPRKFAVVSAASAAGYSDFENHLHNNEYGFSFQTDLYPAPMQGAAAPQGIISVLSEIDYDNYDAVLILRGGGSNIDLSCFDDYDLSVNIANYPIPVMCAIGHNIDYHICDMVSCVSVKTPTALADYIIDIFIAEDSRIATLANRLNLALNNKVSSETTRFEIFVHRVKLAISEKVARESSKLDVLEHKVLQGNPVALLEKGYSMALKEGKRFETIDEVAVGEKLELMLKDGIIECVINDIIKK